VLDWRGSPHLDGFARTPGRHCDFAVEWPESPESRPHLPIRTWLIVHESEVARVVHWLRLVLSLRDFVSTIEAQTRIRHKFHGCGNGWTILWGNDCSFGLGLRDPTGAFP
jgi:hypothetical protein